MVKVVVIDDIEFQVDDNNYFSLLFLINQLAPNKKCFIHKFFEINMHIIKKLDNPYYIKDFDYMCNKDLFLLCVSWLDETKYFKYNKIITEYLEQQQH